MIATHLYSILPIFKHPDYSGEKEWRLFEAIVRNNQAKFPEEFDKSRLVFNPNFKNSKERFLKKTHNIKHQIQLCSFAFSDIQKIVVGPRLDYAQAEQWIKKILRKHKRDNVSELEIENIQIDSSKRSYR